MASEPVVTASLNYVGTVHALWWRGGCGTGDQKEGWPRSWIRVRRSCAYYLANVTVQKERGIYGSTVAPDAGKRLGFLIGV